MQGIADHVHTLLSATAGAALRLGASDMLSARSAGVPEGASAERRIENRTVFDAVDTSPQPIRPPPNPWHSKAHHYRRTYDGERPFKRIIVSARLRLVVKRGSVVSTRSAKWGA